MNIEDYDIVREPGEKKLKESVKRIMKEGWEPIGGVSVSQYEYIGEYALQNQWRTAYCQAMIKTKP